MPASDELRLDGALDAGRVPLLHRQLRGQRGWRRIDLSAVTAVDSAGVAFVRELQGRSADRAVLSGVPAHYRQLCIAHRLPCEGD